MTTNVFAKTMLTVGGLAIIDSNAAKTLKHFYCQQRVCASVHRGEGSGPGGSGNGGCLVPGGIWSGGSGPGGPGPGGSGPGRILLPRGVPGGDPPGQPLLRVVCILLECILVIGTFERHIITKPFWRTIEIPQHTRILLLIPVLRFIMHT